MVLGYESELLAPTSNARLTRFASFTSPANLEKEGPGIIDPASRRFGILLSRTYCLSTNDSETYPVFWCSPKERDGPW